jgi:16S rRNA (adenine1518-N6/adenine1519-N6)-dimethyltransferase
MPTKLGQNFLKNESVVKKIIKAANLKADDLVVEIGPGKGILTEELLKYAGKLLAIEIDNNLAEMLQNKFRNNTNIEIIEEDILKVDFNKLLGSRASKYKVIANLPYYITSPIIRLLLETENHPSEMILMVQKEVAKRIVASPGKMSILAVSVQYYAKAEILFEVGKENFDPVPEVDSAVICITYNMKQRTRNKEYNRKFFQVVRAGFCAKRKTLANNLANSFHLDKKEVEEKLKKVGLTSKTRAQELSVEDWKKLAPIF